jgi:hypothetical protein
MKLLRHGYTDILKNEFLEQLIILALMKMILIDSVRFQYYKFQMNEYGTSRSEFYPIDTAKFIKDNYSKIREFTRY